MEKINQIDSIKSNEIDNLQDNTGNIKKEVSEILAMPNRKLNYKEVSEILVSQLREYLNASGQKGFVVGVSGGIDSALVSTLCAMTGEKVTVMDLPIHQKNDEVNRANNHMNWLQEIFPNIERYSIDLTETFETFKKALPEISDETARYMAYVNSRSRLRAVTLYAIGNEKNHLVVGTGNKVEDYGIGFFTKYGDGAVDISPIGNLYKSEVYEMARFLGVNDEILKARPTDGLHPNGATDEDQIGCSYDELEWAMVQYDNGKRNNDFEGRAKYVMEIYSKRHEVNAHKMEMPKVFEI